MTLPETTPALSPEGTRRRDLASTFVNHLRATPRAWAIGLLASVPAYLLAMRLATGANRPEQIALCALACVLVFWGEATRRFLFGMLPFLLFGVIYDLTHITQPLVKYLHVHVAEPYHFDLALFGIPTAAGRLTPNEFFARHHWAVVDFFTGLAYIIFVYWSLAFAVYLAIWRRDEEGRRLLNRFAWTFLFLNLAGFLTYYIYPAAPPWYVADHGLGPADLTVRSSAAGAARWDALTGIPYFAAFYGRSADVFGAIPSLHIAYPLLTFLYATELRKRWLNWSNFLFFSLVCFSAIYLNHHYMLDVLLGVLYTLTSWGIERALRRRPRAA